MLLARMCSHRLQQTSISDLCSSPFLKIVLHCGGRDIWKLRLVWLERQICSYSLWCHSRMRQHVWSGAFIFGRGVLFVVFIEN